MRTPCRQRRSTGFSLLEMMIVVAIIGIMARIAIPAFNEMIDRQRAKNAASDIYVALSRARSEALRLSQNVTLLPNSGTTDWTSGWTIEDPTVPGNLFENHEAVSNVTITGTTNSVTYRSSGRVLGATRFTITGDYPGSTRYVCLNLSGRPSINTTGSC